MNPLFSNLPRQPFPTVVDNSMLTAFRSCETKGILEYLYHLTKEQISIHLIAGNAYACALEEYRNHVYIRNGTHDEGTGLGIKAIFQAFGQDEFLETKKSVWDVCFAFLHYLRTYPPNRERYKPFVLNGRPTVEFSFILPLDILHPDTGEPILYSGRADQLVRDEETGLIYLEDDKTTSELGATFESKFTLSSQFTGYTVAAREYGIDVRGTLVRAMCFYAQGLEARQLLTLRTPENIELWKYNTLLTIRRMIEAWRTSSFSLSLGDACTSYGGCPFTDYCRFTNMGILLQDFHRSKWNPLTRQREKSESLQSLIDKHFGNA